MGEWMKTLEQWKVVMNEIKNKVKVKQTINLVLRIKMIDIQKKLDVKNIHGLVDYKIKGKFKTNNLTDE